MKNYTIIWLIIFSLFSIKSYCQGLDLNAISKENTMLAKHKNASDSFDRNKNNIENGNKLGAYYGLQKSKQEIITQIRNFSEDQNEVEKFKRKFESEESKKVKRDSFLKPIDFKKLSFASNKKFSFNREHFSNNINYKSSI